jgi:methylated-DNA-[protein]-cysteine S-methyltransferase
VTLLLDRIASPVGALAVVSDGAALCALAFDDHEDWLTRHLAQHYRDQDIVPAHDPGGFSGKLAAYFDGALDAIDEIPVRLAGSDFQRAVWAALREIPVGSTTTYGALAKRLGKPPGASRAVGLANGANPVAIVVPCHRVIGAHDRLVGYGGGLARKQWLLAHERVELALTAPQDGRGTG